MVLTFLSTTYVPATLWGRLTASTFTAQGAVFHDDALKVGWVTVATIKAYHLQLGICASRSAGVRLLQQLCLFPFSLPRHPISVSPPYSPPPAQLSPLFLLQLHRLGSRGTLFAASRCGGREKRVFLWTAMWENAVASLVRFISTASHCSLFCY